VDGDWLTDGRIMFSRCSIIGPYIARVEKLAVKKAKDDRIRGQEEADRLMEWMEDSTLTPATELGWCRETIVLSATKKVSLDVMYLNRNWDNSRVPFLADYVRLLKSFVDYDEVRLSERRDQPAWFYRHGELVAICTPLAIS
jgi:hypothetical protein